MTRYFCPKCGKELTADQNFCDNCGAKNEGLFVKPLSNPTSAPQMQYNQPPRKKTPLIIALVLAFFGLFFWPFSAACIIISVIERQKGANRKLVTAALVAGIATGIIGSVVSYCAAEKRQEAAKTGVTIETEKAEPATTVEESTVVLEIEEKKQEEKKAEIPEVAVKNGTVYVEKTSEMHVGDAVKCKEQYVGLNHLKIADSATTALGTSVDIGGSNEVIVAFIEIYNPTKEVKSLRTSNFSAYADGNLLGEPDSFLLLEEDRIKQTNGNKIDGGTQRFLLLEYQVPKGCGTFSLFCEGSDWKIDASEITKDPFDGKSIYELDIKREPTELSTVLYSGSDYELVYDGALVQKGSNSWSGPYVVFEYTITNKKDSALDLALTDYNLRGYKDNYLMDVASYVEDASDGHLHIFDVKEVMPGMKAQVCVTFEITGETAGEYYMVFDDGYSANRAIAEATFVCQE